MQKNLCRVCGYDYQGLPWGEDGKTPSFEICPCCGVEFGYEDATPLAISRFRAAWIADGLAWSDPSRKPDGWNAKEQLKKVIEVDR